MSGLMIFVIVANIPVYILFGKIIFNDFETFKEALDNLPDTHSFFEERTGGLSIFFWIGCCCAAVYGEMKLLGMLS